MLNASFATCREGFISSTALVWFTQLCLVSTDLKLSNIFIPMEGHSVGDRISEFLESGLPLAYEPRLEPLISPEPLITYRSHTLPRVGPSWDEWHLAIDDFGEAVPLEHIRERWGLPVMPSGLRAPEVTLGSIWGQAIDIWALGALFRTRYGTQGKDL
ncbi:hypothetical protein BDV98DRAFT_93857 [Pterulicium gracile]|uniref:Protein kinase domain-containing protein n=1 Tax=Pterulicium gracile TaxID=1884261 RepID=A0A5C3QG97_9AGAR|nr:hypothetical protein BDV98DRAFT_93857 [Pterula gracilis]